MIADHLSSRAHLLCSLQSEATGEDREPLEEKALGGGQEVVAPIERGFERLLVWWHVAQSAGEQGELLVEALD